MQMQRRGSYTSEPVKEQIPSGYNTATENANYVGAGKLGTGSTFNIAQAYNDYYEKNEPEKYPTTGDPYDILKAANRKAAVAMTLIIAVFAADILINLLALHRRPGFDFALLVAIMFVVYIISVKSQRVRANSIFKKQIVMNALRRRYPYMEYCGEEQIHIQNILASEIFPKANLNFGHDYCKTDNFQFCRLRLCYYENPKYSDEYTTEVFNGIFAMVKLRSPLDGRVKLRNLQRSYMSVDGLYCVNRSKSFDCCAYPQEAYAQVVTSPMLDCLENFAQKYNFNVSVKDDAMYLAIYYKKDWFELGVMTDKEKISAAVNADMEKLDEIYGFLNRVSELV